MWVKIVGSIFIILSTSFCGFEMARRSAERPRQLRQLIAILETLKSYINYLAMPLPEAFLNSAKGIEGPLVGFCQEVSRILRCNGLRSPEQAIAEAFGLLGGQLVLSKTDKEILQILGANLGMGSKDEQYAYISMVQEQLRNLEQDAILMREQNVRMYRYMGIFSGLTIAIVLV